MQQNNQQQKIMQQLNTFLKNFKAIVTAKLRIIQSLLSGIGQYTHQALLSKISLKQAIDHSSYLETYIIISAGTIGKLVYRFCLRINQFLQYRLCELKNRQQIYIKNEVNTFQKNINNIFKQLNDQPQLKIVLKQILTVQYNFSFRLLQKISQNCNSLSKNNNHFITKQSLIDISKIFNQKFSINSNNYQNQSKILSKNQYYQSQIYSQSTLDQSSQSTCFINKLNKKQNYKKIKNMRENYQSSFQQWNGTLPYIPSSSKNSNLECCIHSQHINNNKYLPYNPQNQKFKHFNPTHVRRHTLENKHGSLSKILPGNELHECLVSHQLKLNNYGCKDISFLQASYQNKKSKKQLYIQALSSIMQIEQHPYGSYSNDYLMQQLVNLNKKNQIMIDKFRKRYNKKKVKSQKYLLSNVNGNNNKNYHETISQEKNDKKTKNINDQLLFQKITIVDMKKKKLPNIPKKSNYIK